MQKSKLDFLQFVFESVNGFVPLNVMDDKFLDSLSSDELERWSTAIGKIRELKFTGKHYTREQIKEELLKAIS